MLKNHFILAYRNLLRNRFSSLLNITGLTVGVTCFILLTVYIRHEVSFDKFHSKGDRIYALGNKVNSLDDGATNWEKYMVSYASLMKERIPELNNMAMIGEVGMNNLVIVDGEGFYENDVLWANDELFEIFDFPVINGETRLYEPGTAVMTQRIASKYFGEEDPIGKLLEVKDKGTYEITALVSDPPANSHIQFGLLLSAHNTLEEAKARFGGRGGSVSANYILMPEKVDPEDVMKKMEELMLAEWPDHSIKKDEQGKLINDLYFLPLEDVHLRSGFTWALRPVNDIRYIFLFASIAVLILVIACLNYINLVTAKSIKRIKEVGLRKVIGAGKKQIAWMALSEAFVFALVSVVIAFALAERLLPFFNGLVDRNLTISYLSWDFLIFALVLSLLVGLASGAYPALRLSKFSPADSLCGAGKTKEKSTVRRGLVFFQFFIAQGLIVATVIIQSQLSYLQTKDLGYDKEHVLYINAHDELKGETEVFRNEVNKLPGVVSVSMSDAIIQYNGISFMPMKKIEGFEDAEDSDYLIYEVFDVDEHFIETMGMELVEGEGFNVSTVNENAIVISEGFKAKLGWDEALGKTFNKKTVVGVIRDFHNESLKVEVRPIVLSLYKESSQFISIKVSAGETRNVVDALDKLWGELATERPFDFQFYDEYYRAQYESEQRLGQIFNAFSFIAICISILGLIGLTAFSAEQRLKEFGIRKVLGANVRQIVYLLSKEFFILILIAFIVASPIAYYGLTGWLNEFVYRIELNALTFVIALLTTLAIALFAVAYQSLKVSKTNPAEILRTE